MHFTAKLSLAIYMNQGKTKAPRKDIIHLWNIL